MLFGSRSRPLIGLDITTSSIKLVELTQSGKSYRAESYAAEPTPPNAINEKTIVDAPASGSSPLTWKIGASTISAMSVG